MLTKKICLALSDDMYKSYVDIYTSTTLHTFLRLCLQKAIDDRSFFDAVFFGDVLSI